MLAHDRCNGAKADHLAAEDHLAAWVERNRRSREEFDGRLGAAGLPADETAATSVAAWAYAQTEASRGQVWVAERLLRPLGPGWSTVFGG